MRVVKDKQRSPSFAPGRRCRACLLCISVLLAACGKSPSSASKGSAGAAGGSSGIPGAGGGIPGADAGAAGSDGGTPESDGGDAGTPNITQETGRTLDTLKFGDDADEAAHGLTTGFSPVLASVAPIPSEPPATAASDVIVGGLGLRARRLLPRSPNADYYGGEMTFTMSVDPVAQNYFTAKIYGSESSQSWLVLNVDGYEVGARHGGDNDEEMFLNSSGWFPGRFIYRTVRLPWQLTRGKKSVKLELRSLGSIDYYASGAYDNYQARMAGATIGIYACYTHTGAALEISAEAQGTAPAPQSPRPSSPDATFVSNWKRSVDANVNRVLSTNAASLAGFQVLFAAQAYGRSWSVAYQNPAVIAKTIAAFDAMVTAYSASPSSFSPNSGGGGCTQWGLNFGEIGYGVALLWNDDTAASWLTAMSATVAYGGSLGTITRKEAWSTVLRATVDQGRYHRKTISNQQLMSDFCTYVSNRALLLVDTQNALLEAEAKRYVYEAAGISPWLGNDQIGGGNTPLRGTAPYGSNWLAITDRGTTKEEGLVGGDYGEVGSFVFDMATFMDDSTLRARALKLLRARAGLRYPTIDSGGYLSSVAAEQIGCRNDQEINGHVVYLGRASYQDLQVGAQGAGIVGADLVGYLQQQADEGQLQAQLSANNSPAFGSYWSLTGSPDVPDFYTAFRAQPATHVVLPMTAGAPDFAWGDEENMAVAAKHGEERFWAVLDWRSTNAINRLAKIFVSTAQTARLAEVTIDDVQYNPSGGSVTRTGSVEGVVAYTPPDNPIGASRGVTWPLALQSDGELPVRASDGGRAAAYTLRYGHWLVAINARSNGTYEARLPADFASGVDLVSGKTITGKVTLAPKTTAVFYLASESGPIQPVSVLSASALGGNHEVLLSWDATPGASSYVVERSQSSGGPYDTLATGVASTTYADSSASNGTAYYYLIAGQAADGASGATSPEASATPRGGTLMAPWLNADIGAVGLAGTASYAGGVFTVIGSGADIWGTSDEFQFAAQPMAGDGSITARVVAQTDTQAWSKVGVMMRDGLSPSARQVMTIISPSNGAQFAYRSSAGGSSSADAALTGVAAPYWVRLTRSGNAFTGYVSPDGAIWAKVGAVTIAMTSAVLAGLVVSSHDNTKLSTTLFDNVTLPTLP